MPKRCPPGVICIENITITITIFIVCAVLYFLNSRATSNPTIVEKVVIQKNRGISNDPLLNPYIPRPIRRDVLMNPYDPPTRDDRILLEPPLRGVPINVQTQGVESSYRQIGILTNNAGKILPLMGRPLLTNRDKWNFYTMTDNNHMIKLPVSHHGRSCTNEYGCDNIYNGDVVYVEGYNDAFKATVYDNNIMKYIPFV